MQYRSGSPLLKRKAASPVQVIANQVANLVATMFNYHKQAEEMYKKIQKEQKELKERRKRCGSIEEKPAEKKGGLFRRRKRKEQPASAAVLPAVSTTKAAAKPVVKQQQAAVASDAQSVQSSAAQSVQSSASSVTSSFTSVLTKKQQQAQQSLQQIQAAIASQEAREASLEQQCEATTLQAREKFRAGSKAAALRSLRKVKLWQVERQKIGGILEKLDAMQLSIESSLHSVNVISAMKAGSSAMKDLEKDMGGIAKIDEMMMDMEENLDVQQDIADLLASPGMAAANLVGHDDDALLAELAELTANDTAAMESSLPVAPTGAVNASVETVLASEEAEPMQLN